MKMRHGSSNRSSNEPLSLQLWVLLFTSCCLISRVDAITQTAALDVRGRTTTNRGADGSISSWTLTSYTLLASQASFGSWPPMGADHNQPRQLQLPPSDNPLLCNDITSSTSSSASSTTTSSLLLYRDSILLVPRGTCTFEIKAWHAQQLGATAIIIYGTLASRYALNDTMAANDTSYIPTEKDIIYPTNLHDYDCNNGRAMIPKSQLSFDPLPYNAQQNDVVLQGGDNSLCRQLSPDQLQNCPSQACLLTGLVVKENDNDEDDDEKMKMEACCAWDFHIWLYNDVTAFNATSGQQENKVVTIPAVYVTMQQGQQLLQDLEFYGQNGGDFSVTIYGRWRPSWNPSSFLIWTLGVTIAAIAAYMSAQDYHSHIAKETLRRQARSASSPPRRRNNGEQQQQQPPRLASAHGEQSLELTAVHAVGFIIMASTSLLVLFYFKIYGIVKVMYALGCSKAVSIILFHPLVTCILNKTGIVQNKILVRTGTEEFGDVTLVDIVSHVAGYTLGFVWLFIALTVRHAETVTFFWITQDIFGACMCILFLQVIKLNSMRVAAILLMVAFFYDIFFVFISPMFFSKSVMMDVATSGGPPTADPLWCEKYPDDKNCQGGDPLPMLLTIPRLLDYQGGSSLLGLGDIVLPGLLLSFAARYDSCKSLLGIMGGGNGNLNSSYACPERKLCYNCTLCSGGYFLPAVIAYAIGLCMANMAVYLMEMGQPALLYLVPCCLGTVLGMGYRRNEIKELWDGPKIIRAADAIVYPNEYQDGNTDGNGAVGGNDIHNYLSSAAATHHLPLPQTDAEYDDDDKYENGIGLDVPTIPSARDDNDDDDINAEGRSRK